MGLYEGIKDVAKIVQQADNLDLYRSLLDLSAQALDMQAEIANLTKENEELKRELFKEKNVIRHKEIYITLKDDEEEIAYCASCYGKDNKFIQMFRYDESYYRCPVCRVLAKRKV